MTSLLLALLVATPVGAAAPDRGPGPTGFRRLAIPDDSPAHLCTALAQDRAGFLWIGTQGGVVRFDGFDFQTLSSREHDPEALAGSYVRTLLAARDGRLWVGTFSNGLSVYDPAREAFTRHQHQGDRADSLSHDRVEALAEDRDGSIWVATYAGLDHIDARTGRLERVPLPGDGPEALGDDRLRALLVDRSGALWVGGRGGLLRREPGRGGQRFLPVSVASGPPPFVSRLFQDASGRVWVGTADDGALVLDSQGRLLRRLRPRPAQADGLSHFYVYAISPGAEGEIWLGTFGGGVDVVDARSLQVVDRVRHDPSDESTPGGDRIGALLRDSSGLVWVGTWGQGVARHDPAARAFLPLRHSPNRPWGLSHPAVVRAREMRDGTIWAGTNGNGVDILDAGLRRVGALRPEPGDPGALADGSVTCLEEGRDGTVWVATLDGTLHRLAPGRRRCERFTAERGLPGGAIRSLAFGPDGALWVGSSEGLARLDPRSGRIVAFRHDPADANSLSSHEVEALAFDREGRLWVGTDSGLNAFDPATGRAVRILKEPGRVDGLPNNWVPDLLVDAQGRLWVATQGGAAILTGWDGRTARFDDLSARLGRAAEPVEALVEDAEGLVWLGPRLRVDPRTWTARALSLADGLGFRSFFIASRSRTAQGRLLFGSPEGLLVVRPELLQPWAYEPPVRATALRVEGQARRGAAVLERLELAADERAFQLRFAALDLSGPHQTRYRYRLEGFDPGWTATDAAQRTASYTNLPPGSYVLRVRGTNRAGRTSRHELRLPVEVAPAFHQTRTFQLLAAALGLGVVYAAHRLRTGRLQARGRELERLVGERTRELQAAYLRIEEASLTDPLTGLRNRRFLDRALQADADLAARRHADGGPAAREADLVFFVVDLDHFKRVNDSFGHAAGDAVLQQAAATLEQLLRSSDYVVRWGGEEFLVVARFVDRREAARLAEKIRAGVAGRAFRPDGRTTLALTCSVGFATYPFSRRQPRAVSWERVVEVADAGLYAAKRAGRARWVGFEAGETQDPEELLRQILRGEAGLPPGVCRSGPA